MLMNNNETVVVHPWHAIRVASGTEFTVTDIFQSTFDLESWCPRFPASWIIRGRRYTKVLPYLHGWLFSRFPADDAYLWHDLHNIRGVLAFLGGATPAPIPDHDMDRLRTRLDERPWDFTPASHPFKSGDQVTFTDGPWTSHIGRIISATPLSPKLAVEIALLGRDITVLCSASWLTLVSDPASGGQRTRAKRRTKGKRAHKFSLLSPA